jgi:hypothetical protein
MFGPRRILQAIIKPNRVKYRYFASETYFSGFDLIRRRSANIIANVTDRQPCRMLELYPDGGMYSFFQSEPSYLAVTACTGDENFVNTLCAIGYYADVDVFHGGTALPYNNRSFHFVSALRPTNIPKEVPFVSIDEWTRVIGEQGYALIGAPNAVWEHYDLMNTIMDLESSGIDVMSIQKIDLNGPPINDQMEPKTDADGDGVGLELGEVVEDPYFLALVRRR